jgi:WD40 repeat protein
MWSVCFSPDGSILASGSNDQTVRLWDRHTGECLRLLQGHTGLVSSVCFGPDSSVLASASNDETIRLWDVKTGTCLRILRSRRPYEGMNIAGAVGLTPTQVATLERLGALDEAIPQR